MSYLVILNFIFTIWRHYKGKDSWIWLKPLSCIHGRAVSLSDLWNWTPCLFTKLVFPNEFLETNHLARFTLGTKNVRNGLYTDPINGGFLYGEISWQCQRSCQKSRFLEDGHDDILMSWVYKPILPGLMSLSPIVIGLLSGGGDSPSLP